MGFEQLAELKKQLTREAKAKAREKAEAAKPQSSGAPGQKQAQKPTRGPRPAKPSRPHAGAPAQAKPPAPQVDPVVHVIGKLQKRFPAAFPKNPAPKVPLKIGILADLVAQAESLKLSEDEIREAVSTWCRGSRYWACLTDGAARVDLNGEPAGVVTTRDATFARKQARQATGGPRRKGGGKPAPANAPATEGQAAQAQAAESTVAPAADAASTDAPAQTAPEAAAAPQSSEDNSEA
jgi:ProP effector